MGFLENKRNGGFGRCQHKNVELNKVGANGEPRLDGIWVNATVFCPKTQEGGFTPSEISYSDSEALGRLGTEFGKIACNGCPFKRMSAAEVAEEKIATARNGAVAAAATLERQRLDAELGAVREVAYTEVEQNLGLPTGSIPRV